MAGARIASLISLNDPLHESKDGELVTGFNRFQVEAQKRVAILWLQSHKRKRSIPLPGADLVIPSWQTNVSDSRLRAHRHGNGAFVIVRINSESR